MKIKSVQPAVDLKEPVKSTDFAALESLKNQRKTVGLKASNLGETMPTTDQKLAVQKDMEMAAKQNATLTLHDWEWLRRAYLQAITIDELNRQATRKDHIRKTHLKDELWAQTLTNLKLIEQAAKDAADASELRRIEKDQAISAEQRWQEWIKKIDRKTIANNRELFEMFLHHIGFKLGFIPLASNQKHLTELKESLSLTALKEQKRAQATQLHLERQIESMQLTARTIENLTLIKRMIEREYSRSQEEKIRQQISLELAQEENLEMFLHRLGFKKGYIRLASNQDHLTKIEPSLSKTFLLEERKIKSEEYKQNLVMDLAENEKVRKFVQDDINKLSRKQAEEHEQYLLRLLLKSWGFKLGFVRLAENQKHITEMKTSLTDIKSAAVETDQQLKESEQQKLEDFQQGLERMSRNAALLSIQDKLNAKIAESKEQGVAIKTDDFRDDKRRFLLAMGFKPGFLPTPEKALELSLKEEDMARLKVEKDETKDVPEKDKAIELAQMQVAAQMAQAQATSSDLKNIENRNREAAQPPLQKIKAAK